MLPVERAFALPVRLQEQRWLVTDLWSSDAVGIVGGNDKVLQMRRSEESRPK
jgi:hypothetical protein